MPTAINIIGEKESLVVDDVANGNTERVPSGSLSSTYTHILDNASCLLIEALDEVCNDILPKTSLIDPIRIRYKLEGHGFELKLELKDVPVSDWDGKDFVCPV